MKKVLILSALVVLGSMAFAQRPVQKKTVSTNNTTTQTVNTGKDLNGVRTATSNVKTYVYTVQSISVPNVTVSDANITVTPNNSQNKVKVAQNGTKEFTYYIYDANNQAVTKGEFKTSSMQLDMKNYQPGEYRLQLIDRQKDAEKNFRITKKEK